jgi:hypothetical protein
MGEGWGEGSERQGGWVNCQLLVIEQVAHGDYD